MRIIEIETEIADKKELDSEIETNWARVKCAIDLDKVAFVREYDDTKRGILIYTDSCDFWTDSYTIDQFIEIWKAPQVLAVKFGDLKN